MPVMEKQLEKMKEYLKMDTEIPFGEFSEYYHEVMDGLQANYEAMSRETLFRAKYILQIVANNAFSRAQRKGDLSKKYKKMGEKANFWCKAIDFRLAKEGMSQEEIDQAVEAVNPES